MDRLTFLRSMLGNAALLTLPPLHILPKEQQDRLAWTQDCHLIYIYDNYVRGFQFHQGAQVLARIKEEDPLDLVREYDNEHDTNAVAVYWEGHKLGYLPMGENVSLAYMMDHGLLLQAEVVYTQPEAEPWEQCFIAVHLLMPNNPSFSTYINHYMDRPDAGYKRRPEHGGVVELPKEPEPVVQRVVKQQAAVELLGLKRFMVFIEAVCGSENPPASFQWMLKDATEKGRDAACRRINGKGFSLEVQQFTADSFRIDFGYANGDVGDGGQWDVWYTPVGNIERMEPCGWWRA